MAIGSSLKFFVEIIFPLDRVFFLRPFNYRPTQSYGVSDAVHDLQRALDRSLYDLERKQCFYTSILVAMSTTARWLWWKKSPPTIVSFLLKEQIFKLVQPCIIYLDGQWHVFVEKSRDVLSFDLSTYPSTQWCAFDSATDCPKRIIEAGMKSSLYFQINGRLFYL